MKSLPEGDGDAQFEIVIDGPDGTEVTKFLTDAKGVVFVAEGPAKMSLKKQR